AGVKMTSARTAVAANSGSDGAGAASAAERPDAYGRFVMENVVAVNHDHYFNFRLDLDVDGSENSFQLDQLKAVRLPENHPRKSIWVREESSAGTEAEGKRHRDMAHQAFGRVVSPRS